MTRPIDPEDYPTSARLARTVRDLRKALGLSAQAVADRSAGALTRNTIANIESGRVGNISIDQLTAFARAFEVAPADLLTERALADVAAQKAQALREAADRIEREWRPR